MAVPTPNQYWIRPDALTITLNTPDVDYLRATVLAGSVIIAYMKGVIDYDPSHNYRKWTIQAADTFLETTGEYYVHAQLTRSESPATALIVYSLTKRSITGKTVEADGAETGEEDKDHFYIYLGKISASIDKDGQKVGRTWLEEYNPGKLDTNQGRTEDMEGHYLSRLFNDTASGLIRFLKGLSLGESRNPISSVITAENAEDSTLYTENALLSAAAFSKLFSIAKDDKGNSYIRTPYPLASDSTVSSLGVGEDEGGTGGTAALYQLVDVLRDGDKVSGAEDGNVLMYDAATGKWYGKKVNIPEVDFSDINDKFVSIDGLIRSLQEKDVAHDESITAHGEAITALQTKDTAIEQSVTSLQGQFDTLVSGDSSSAIESFNEVVEFLKDIEDDSTLEGILAGKQNAITDLATIRANAALGATALQSSDLDGYVNEIATSGSGNAITSVTKSGKKLTFNKASSFFLAGNFTEAKIKSTLGISDWALASSKPSYKTSEVTESGNLYFTTDRVKNYLTGAVSSVLTLNLTASRALVSNASGKIAVSAVTSTELGYLDGVTSAIQTQLNALSARIKAYEDILKIEENGTLLHATVAFASDSTVSSLGVGSDDEGNIGGVIDLTNVVTNIVPSMDGLNIGSASSRWSKLYVTRIENSQNDLDLDSGGYIRMLTDVVFGNNDNFSISPTGTAYLGNIYSNGNIVATLGDIDSKLSGYALKSEVYSGVISGETENGYYKISLSYGNGVGTNALIPSYSALGFTNIEQAEGYYLADQFLINDILDYVDNAVKNVNVNVDLSNYYTKTQVHTYVSQELNTFSEENLGTALQNYFPLSGNKTITGKVTISSAGLLEVQGNVYVGGKLYSGLSNNNPYATQDWVESQGYTSNIGTVTGVRINGSTKNPSSGIVDLGYVASYEAIADVVEDYLTYDYSLSSDTTDAVKLTTLLGRSQSITATTLKNSLGLKALAYKDSIDLSAYAKTSQLENYYTKDAADSAFAKVEEIETLVADEIGLYLPNNFSVASNTTNAVSVTIGSNTENISAATLKTSLGLGEAAYKAVGAVASGNTGLVTGGSVYTAIKNVSDIVTTINDNYASVDYVDSEIEILEGDLAAFITATEVDTKLQSYATKATTLAGYGITDAYTKTAADERYLKLTGGEIKGSLGVTGSITAQGGTFANGLKVGGNNVIHSGNIGSQSVASAGILRSYVVFPFEVTNSTYRKFATITLSIRYFGKVADLKLFTGRSTYDRGNSCDLHVMCYQQDSLGTSPRYSIETNNDDRYFKIYGVLNVTSSSSTLDLYAYGNNWSYYQLYVVQVSGDNIISIDSSNVSELPSGTVITPTKMGSVYSASKLTTPRTIWGQSFDGSGDIGGNLYLGEATLFGYNGKGLIEAGKTSCVICYGYRENPLSLWASTFKMWANSATALFINSSGNTILGSNNDLATTSYKLYVNGNSYVNGELKVAGRSVFSAAMTCESNLYVSGHLLLNGSNIRGYNNYSLIEAGSDVVHIGYGYQYNGLPVHLWGSPIRFAASGHYDMTIESNGNVLIGTTTDSGYKLYVNGNSYVNGELKVAGRSVFSAAMTCESNLYVNGSLTVSGGITMGGNTVATQTWVQNQGYATTTSVNNSLGSLSAEISAVDARIDALGTAASKNWTGAATTDTTNLVTIGWVESKLAGYATAASIPTKTSQLTNDSNFVSGRIETTVTGGGVGLVTGGAVYSFVEGSLSGYAKKATTLSGYGITDALPKSNPSVTGTLTVAGNVLPSNNNDTYALGSANYRWSKLYANGVDSTGTISSTTNITAQGNVTAINGGLSGKTLSVSGAASVGSLTVNGVAITGNGGFNGGTVSGETIFGSVGSNYMDTYQVYIGGVYGGGLGVEGLIDAWGGVAGNGWEIMDTGDAYFQSCDTASDYNLKTIIKDVRLSLGTMANAPLVQFDWKNKPNSKHHIGTIAQYWDSCLPEVVSRTKGGTLALGYGELGVAMGISLANILEDTNGRVASVEEEIKALKEENKRLKERVAELEAA